MDQFKRVNGEIKLGNYTVGELLKEFGSPLYVYDETTLRERCRSIKQICSLPNFRIYYSAKANTAIAILKIIREEGLFVDAMSLGELYQEELAGFSKNEILFLSNNVCKEDFREIIKKDIRVCIDSLSQLDVYCGLKPNKGVYIRVNPGKGDGHSDKVVTAGKVKFGIDIDAIEEAFEIAASHKCQITGFQIHIGSQFLTFDIFIEAIQKLLNLAKGYPQIEFIDFGGGVGITYDRSQQKPFPIEKFSSVFTQKLTEWMEETGRRPTFAMEPGRYIVAESGVCLSRVQSVKVNCGIPFVGVDLGFNFLVRPEMYGSYHEIVQAVSDDSSQAKKVNVVGNVCESGDYLGKDRLLPAVKEEDILLIRDTGAYGFAMSSNYNSMPRPAEVMIKADGKAQLIRKRETLEDLVKNQVF